MDRELENPFLAITIAIIIATTIICPMCVQCLQNRRLLTGSTPQFSSPQTSLFVTLTASMHNVITLVTVFAAAGTKRDKDNLGRVPLDNGYCQVSFFRSLLW